MKDKHPEKGKGSRGTISRNRKRHLEGLNKANLEPPEEAESTFGYRTWKPAPDEIQDLRGKEWNPAEEVPCFRGRGMTKSDTEYSTSCTEVYETGTDDAASPDDSGSPLDA